MLLLLGRGVVLRLLWRVDHGEGRGGKGVQLPLLLGVLLLVLLLLVVVLLVLVVLALVLVLLAVVLVLVLVLMGKLLRIKLRGWIGTGRAGHPDAVATLELGVRAQGRVLGLVLLLGADGSCSLRRPEPESLRIQVVRARRGALLEGREGKHAGDVGGHLRWWLAEYIGDAELVADGEYLLLGFLDIFYRLCPLGKE
jgi:hypothetical protein